MASKACPPSRNSSTRFPPDAPADAIRHNPRANDSVRIGIGTGAAGASGDTSTGRGTGELMTGTDRVYGV